MRKWMREKLKRRKKSQEEAATGPAPLQPAYFESEPASPGLKPHATELPEPAAEVGNSQTAEGGEREPEANVRPHSPSAPAPGTDPIRRPRRRRRGGRGRRRPGQPIRPDGSEPPAPEAPPTEAPDSPGTSSPPAAVPAASVAAAQARSSKGVVVLAVGLPGSGKSSWFKRHHITPLSSDVLRTMLFDDPSEQRFQDLVFSNLRSMLRARLIARRPLNYVDATNLTPHERHNWIKLAKGYGYEVHAVFFDVPLEVCIERHQRRDRTVPEDVMRKMAAKLRPPTFEEGFSKITVVRVKQKEA
jgi:predicted kinase